MIVLYLKKLFHHINIMIKYIIIKDSKIYYSQSLRDIEKNFNIDHSYLSKIIKKKELPNPVTAKNHTIFIVNSDPNNKIFKYLLINNNNHTYNLYDSLRQIESEVGIDHSSLSKFMNNKKYKTIGGGNRGRPIINNKDDNRKIIDSTNCQDKVIFNNQNSNNKNSDNKNSDIENSDIENSDIENLDNLKLDNEILINKQKDLNNQLNSKSIKGYLIYKIV